MIEFLSRQIYKNRQIIRYIISGGTAALVNLVLLYVLTDVFKIWYLFSSTLAFAVAFFVSFYLQKFWTFRDKGKEKIYQQVGFYFIIAIANLGLNAALMYLSVDILKIWYLLAQILVSGIIAVESFLIYKFLIFNRQARLVSVVLDPKENLKILIATGIYPPDIGGPATMLAALTKSFLENGWAMKIVTYSDKTGHLQNSQTGIEIYRISRNQPALKHYFNYFFQLWKLAEWADVIYATDVYSVGLFTYWIKKITGKKYIIRFAGDSAWETAFTKGWAKDYILDFQNKTYQDGRIEKLKERRKKILINASGIIAVSHFIAQLAQKIGVPENKIKVIYNSVDFEIDNLDLAAAETIKNQFEKNSKIIMTGGRLTSWKGEDVLIKILGRIEQSIGSTKLLILGDGPQLENLKKLARELGLQEKVFFIGRVKQEDMINYLKAADLFILNTNYEGLSHILLEAMAAGTPIVTTNIGGNPEVIEDGKNGLLVDYNSQDQLVAAAVKILNNSQLARNFVEGGKEKLKQFSWDKAVKQTIEFLQKIHHE